MYIQQIYTDCLAQASYYIESEGESIIIDPIRDSSLYLDILRKRKSSLKYIFETHFHADFVSGHVELARLTNASIVFGPKAITSYECIFATHNQDFQFGTMKLRALHTPGHTLESTCYLLISSSNKHEAVFTGDTLFIGEVGRPDLAVNPQLTSQDLAGQLYDSLHNVIMNLADDIIVYPGHGAGSACGKNISSEKQSTIGEQKKSNYALQPMIKKEFIEMVLKGISSPPQYFSHDVAMNKQGYQPISGVLENSVNKLNYVMSSAYIKKGVTILDVRSPHDFEKGFITGSINIGKMGMFAPWVGTIISPKSKIILVCNINEEIEVISRLARIGYENVVGFISDLQEWHDKKELKYIESIYANAIKEDKNNIFILDVRKEAELKLGYVQDSVNIPLSELLVSLDRIPKSANLIIYCAGGYRSMIAASILKSKGFNNIKNVYGGYNEIARNQL